MTANCNSNWLLSLNTDADADAEMQVVIHSAIRPDAGDIVL
jgi:hypothetical protein